MYTRNFAFRSFCNMSDNGRFRELIDELPMLMYVQCTLYMVFNREMDFMFAIPFYAALLPRRGPHIASHSVCLSVRLSVCPSVPLSLTSVTSRHLANYNDTHVLLGTRRGPHIVRPSRPHKFLFGYAPPNGDLLIHSYIERQ